MNPTTGSVMILNVDDYEISRYTKSRVLRQAGYQVKEATTGSQALQLIQQEHPPLVLLDVNLPDIDGLEVCRRIKSDANLASTLVLQISASLVSSTDKARGLEGGADAYLVEPVEPAELVASVKALLRLHQAEEALRQSEERYRSLFNGMTEGFALHEIICDDKGEPCDYRFLEINPSFERLTGFKHEDVVGKLISEILPNNEPYWVKTYGAVALTGKPAHFENYSSALNRHYEVYAYCPAPGQFAVLFIDITERKQAEVELRMSEQKLKALFKLLPIGISILNEERQIVEDNPALAKILDLSEDDLAKGEYGQRAYLRADGTPMLQGEFPSVRAFKEQRNIENVEIGIVKKSGATFWTNVSAVPLPFPDWRVVVITSDVTGRKQAEAEREQLLQQARRDQEAIKALAGTLQRERDTLQTIMENTRAHLAYLDPQFNFVRVNSTYAAGSGHSIEELPGRNHFELFPNPENQAIFEQVRETGQPVAFYAKPFEFADHLERGITYWDWTLAPIKDEEGQVQGLVLSLLDVTERKQAEEKLRQTLESLENSETRFRLVAQMAGEAIITIDSRGKIVFWNKAATTIFCYTADEAIGQPLTLIIPKRFRDDHQFGLAQLIFGSPPHLIGKTVELVGLRRDGAEFPMELSLSTWKIREEVFFTGIIHDITERKQAELIQRQAHQELEQRVRERTAELAEINQTLEQRVEERTRELATLLKVSHNLASTLDMELLLGLILDQLKSVVDCSGAVIYKVEGETFTVVAHREPIPQKEVSTFRFSTKQTPIYQQVILRQTPVIIPDVQDDTPLGHLFRESMGERCMIAFAYVRSWLGVPLMLQERVIGMLGLHHHKPNYYTAQQAELASAFATQAAIAIENARLYEQAQELAAIQERQRLARDLHDSVSQSLFSASLSAEVLPRLWERNPAEGRNCLAELHRLTRGALAEMRTLLLELRPTALVETALGDLLSQLTEAIIGRARLPVTLTVEPHRPLPPEVQLALYRMAQEALNNVIKHAGAGRVEVSLRSVPAQAGGEDGVELRISDNGRGFDADNVPPTCLGLNIMRERAETVGTTLKIKSQIGQGTQVFVAWPNRSGKQNSASMKDHL